jgi:hypothetical protein
MLGTPINTSIGSWDEGSPGLMPRNRALRAAQGAAARAFGAERLGRSEIRNGSMVGNILPSGKPTYNYGKSPGLLGKSIILWQFS